MIKKRLLVLTACFILSILLAGCANNAGNAVSDVASKMGDAVSRAGEDVGETVSRVESFLEGDGDSGAGSVDSGNDGFIGDESGVSSGAGSGLLDDEDGLDSGVSSGLE